MNEKSRPRHKRTGSVCKASLLGGVFFPYNKPYGLVFDTVVAWAAFVADLSAAALVAAVVYV